MNQKKYFSLAVILSAGVGLGSQSVLAQGVPGSRQPDVGIPEKVQPATPGSHEQAPAAMSSEDVKKVKEALKAKGLTPGPMDGTMDIKTLQALRDFQKANSLPVTGTLDKQTAAKLGITLSAQDGASHQGGAERSIPQSKGGAK